MARLFTENCETTSLTSSATTGTGWFTVSGSPAYSSTVYNSSTRSIRINGLASATAKGVLHKFLNTSAAGPYYLRFYMRVDTRPTASNHIASFQASTGTAGTSERAKITLESNGTLLLRNSSGTAVGSASSALTLGIWYCVEFQVYNNSLTTNDVIEGRLDGTIWATSNAQNLGGNVFAFSLGGNLDTDAQTTGDWYFDDIALNDTAGTTDTAYPGLIASGATTNGPKVRRASVFAGAPIKVRGVSAFAATTLKVKAAGGTWTTPTF